MRNVTVLYHPDDILQQFLHIWKSDHFKQAHNDSDCRIYQILQRAADFPLFLYDLSPHPQPYEQKRNLTEAKHFSPWWGGVTRYSIENPIVHDMCWLHDLAHKANMTYLPEAPFHAFDKKMRFQEVLATIESSFAVYLDAPHLREEGGDRPILADRFLQDPYFMRRWQMDPHGAQYQLEQFLAHAARTPSPDDPLLDQIHLYGQLNTAWMNVWRARYQSIEQHMALLQRRISLGADRVLCMDEFMQWLTSDDITQETEIPFYDEAVAFQKEYLRLYPVSVHHAGSSA